MIDFHFWESGRLEILNILTLEDAEKLQVKHRKETFLNVFLSAQGIKQNPSVQKSA